MLDKVVGVALSGVIAVLVLAGITLFIGGIQLLAAKFVIIKIVWLSMGAIVLLLFFAAIWAGIYEKFREKQEKNENE